MTLDAEVQRPIAQFLATPPYHACLVVVHLEVERLQTAVAAIQGHYRWPTLAISQVLSQEVQAVAPRRRPSLAARALSRAIHAHAPGPLLCTDVTLLFEPVLHLDPLRLFLDAGRQTQLVVAWPGSSGNGVLAYATSAHAHYRTWPLAELCDYCVIIL